MRRSKPVSEYARDLRSFIGLCSYYRRFVRGFAEVAAPLHALTSKYALFEWSTDDGRYILDMDASETSIGAVLSQVQNGEERVIAYASRTYNKAERNYCTTRKELLAVIYFISLNNTCWAPGFSSERTMPR